MYKAKIIITGKKIHEIGYRVFLLKQDSMLEKQDSMLEKQDSLLEVTEKGFSDMRTGFREVKEEIHLMRDDFLEMFMREVNELRSEIADI